MSRVNLEDARAYRLRMFATKRASMDLTLTGTFVLPRDGPEVYMLNPGALNQTVRLPVLGEEFSVVIAHVGTTNTISLVDSNGVLVTTIRNGEIKYLFSGPSRWIWLTSNFDVSDVTGMSEELRVVTNPGAQVVGANEAGLALNKAIASATPVALPSVSTRAGRSVRIVDWAGTVDVANPVTVTPLGVEKINNQATWEASNLSSGGIILFPNVALNGWTVGA